jgi:hypothetical protein
MDTLPDFDLEQRVAGLVPKAGEADYALKDTVLQKATKKKNELIEERLHNPAAAVDKLPALAEPLRMYRENPDDPETIQNLIRSRLDAQAKLNIPALQRQPITKDEATRIVRPAFGLVGKELVDTLQKMQGQLEGTYGRYAPSVARSAIQIVVKDHDQAKRMQGIISRAWKGLPLRSSEVREMENLNEASAAEAAFPIPAGVTAAPEMQPVSPQEAYIGNPFLPEAIPQEPATMSTLSNLSRSRGPIKVQTMEEALQLPPGTVFEDPDGNVRVR